MQEVIKSRCISLHSFAYSDSSLIVKALTEKCGIVSFILKDVRRKNLQFGRAFDIFTLSEVVFKQNPTAELQFVKEASIINWHSKLREQLKNLAYAQVMAEIILSCAPQGVALQGEFQLLLNTLLELDSNKSDCIFAKWLLFTCDLWGYHIDLNHCSICGQALQIAAADFFAAQGLICSKCAHNTLARPETLQGFWELHKYASDYSKLKKLSGKIYVENALLLYLKNHMGMQGNLRSLSFLQEVRKL